MRSTMLLSKAIAKRRLTELLSEAHTYFRQGESNSSHACAWASVRSTLLNLNCNGRASAIRAHQAPEYAEKLSL